MSAVILIISLMAACMCIAFGAVRLGSWLIARRDDAANRGIRDASFVAQARAELSATSWTQADEDAYQRSRAREREILASKRGDLMQAACWAEISEAGRG